MRLGERAVRSGPRRRHGFPCGRCCWSGGRCWTTCCCRPRFATCHAGATLPRVRAGCSRRWGFCRLGRTSTGRANCWAACSSGVALAQALLLDPAVLLLDEPFGALDAITREQLNLELLGLWEAGAGTTMLFVTHDLAEAVFLGSRVVVFTAGPARMADNFTDRPALSAHPRHQDARGLRRLQPADLQAARHGVSERQRRHAGQPPLGRGHRAVVERSGTTALPKALQSSESGSAAIPESQPRLAVGQPWYRSRCDSGGPRASASGRPAKPSMKWWPLRWTSPRPSRPPGPGPVAPDRPACVVGPRRRGRTSLALGDPEAAAGEVDRRLVEALQYFDETPVSPSARARKKASISPSRLVDDHRPVPRQRGDAARQRHLALDRLLDEEGRRRASAAPARPPSLPRGRRPRRRPRTARCRRG